ncbi:MAG TPA: hypothetical protein VGI39_24640 [Polyangiaceae bacterium]|jgi:hypothetical protein
MKKKQQETSVASPARGAAKATSSNPLPPIGGADALPSLGAPTPPREDNPVAVDARKGVRVYQGEVDVAESAARELRASTMFPGILSSHFGTAEQIADTIDFAAQWYVEAAAAATWASYTRMQSNLAWNYALAMIDRLRVAYQAVAATDPAIEKELPNFTKLLAVRQIVAAKAVATKRKIKSGEIVVNKSAKPKRLGTQTSTNATSAAPAPAPAPAAAAPAPATVAPEATPVANGANGASVTH